jgi:hypothetical protein
MVRIVEHGMNPQHLYPILLGATAVLAAAAYYWVRSRRKTPEQRERERRERIAAIGRITDGTIVDVCELPAEAPGNGGNPKRAERAGHEAQLLIFQYDVAGVTYETSQDVTMLRPYIDLHRCRLGVPTSVKYDPQNPGNSIVIAEAWSGLRK